MDLAFYNVVINSFLFNDERQNKTSCLEHEKKFCQWFCNCKMISVQLKQILVFTIIKSRFPNLLYTNFTML